MSTREVKALLADLPVDPADTRGFLSPAEGEALAARAAALDGDSPALEIGSYCGRSTVYLGVGCRASGRTLLALDHHRGSEEHQPGELFHDPELVDGTGAFSTLESFRRTIQGAGLEDTVIPVLAASTQFSRAWRGTLAMVFIDGGHSLAAALEDYRAWAPCIERGGVLAIHDVYPAPESGGQAPITVLRLARASGLFDEPEAVDSLRLLRRR